MRKSGKKTGRKRKGGWIDEGKLNSHKLKRIKKTREKKPVSIAAMQCGELKRMRCRTENASEMMSGEAKEGNEGKDKMTKANGDRVME